MHTSLPGYKRNLNHTQVIPIISNNLHLEKKDLNTTNITLSKKEKIANIKRSVHFIMQQESNEENTDTIWGDSPISIDLYLNMLRHRYGTEHDPEEDIEKIILVISQQPSLTDNDIKNCISFFGENKLNVSQQNQKRIATIYIKKHLGMSI